MKNQRDEVISFYKECLSTLRINVDKAGKATMIYPDDSEAPAVVNDKPLYLPVKGTLDGDMMDEVQHFHPLCEALPRKTASPVITYLTKVARNNIAVYLKVILERLMTVAADPNLHDELPPETTDYFKKLQHVKESTVKQLEKLIDSAIRKNSFVTVYCRNGGKYEGESVTRLCTIRFPIISMIEANDTKSLKFSFKSERERKTILALFNYVLPGGYDHETYSSPSNSKVAPFFEAFMLAYEKVAKQINIMIDRHGDSMDFQLTPFPMKAFGKLDKIPEYYNNSRIPTLPGNEGGLKELDEVKKTDHDKVTPPDPNTTRSPQPTASQQPPWSESPSQRQPASNQASQPSPGSTSMDEFRRLMQGNQQPQQPAQQPMQQPMGYPQQQMMGYPQHQQPAQPNNPYAVLSSNQQQQQPVMGYQQPMMNQSAGYQPPQQGFQQHPVNNFNNDPGAGLI